MENSGIRVGVEKFDGKGSFTMWKVRMEDLLVQTGLDVALEDRPDRVSDKEWMSLEKKACATIRACLADDVLYGVIEERTPKGLWSRLHTLYQGRNMCNKLVLKKRLYSLRMSEGEDVAGHIQRFDRLSMDLLNIGVDLDEEDKSLLLLCSLPDNYDSLVTTLLYGKETLIYGEIVSVLRSNEQREWMGKWEVFQEGLAVYDRPRRNRKCEHRGRDQSKDRSKVGRCYRCGVVGHFRRDCPLRKKCQEGESSNFSGSVADSEEHGDLLVCSEGPAVYAVTEQAATGDEDRVQAQQGSGVSTASGLLSVASGRFQPQVEHRRLVSSRMERAVTLDQSSVAGVTEQVEFCSRAVVDSEVEVSDGAPCAASGSMSSLRSLQGNPDVLMRLPDRKGSTSQVGAKGAKHRSSAVEAVTTRASRRMQLLKVDDSGSGCTSGCRDTRLQRSAGGGHCQVCQSLGASRWRM